MSLARHVRARRRLCCLKSIFFCFAQIFSPCQFECCFTHVTHQQLDTPTVGSQAHCPVRLCITGGHSSQEVACTSRCIAPALSLWREGGLPGYISVGPSRRFGTLVSLPRRKSQVRCGATRRTEGGARQSWPRGECLRRRKAAAHASSRSCSPCC